VLNFETKNLLSSKTTNIEAKCKTAGSPKS